MNVMIPQIGDLVRVKTKLNGDILCTIDWISEKSIHFKNRSGFGLTVNADRVRYVNTMWRGASFEYISIN